MCMMPVSLALAQAQNNQAGAAGEALTFAAVIAMPLG
jgi:hypothetical protein